MRKLEIDPEFRDLLPALSEDEFNRLEESVLEEGRCTDPIITWGNIIVDGHNRWKIIQKHPEVKFDTQNHDFADRHEIKYWILQRQIGRRNLNAVEKSLMLAKAFDERKLSVGNPAGWNSVNSNHSQLLNSSVIGGHDSKRGTASIVANDFHTSSSTVEKASYFAKGLDFADSISPGFKQEFRSGTIHAPEKVVRRLYKMPLEDAKKAICAIESGDVATAKEITGVPVKKKRPSNTPPKTGPGSFVHELVETLGSEESTENGFIESEVPHISEDYMTRMNRMFKLHPEAVKSAEGKAVMIEHMTKVKNWIDERMEWYEQEGIG